MKLKDQFIYWPNELEREKIVSDTFHELPYCVGYVDGTEIKLAEKPFDDPEAYFSRKHIYSMKVQAVCDHKRKIRHIVLGYPGSVHDARIYNNCNLSKKTEDYFSGRQWIAGDSAYKLTKTVLTPYRSNSAQNRNNFNRIFSKYRIRIEHSFGIMKERFNSLKELKLQIKNNSSVNFACCWVLVCVILHNILIDENEDVCYIEINEHYVENQIAYENESTAEGNEKRLFIEELMKNIN